MMNTIAIVICAIWTIFWGMVTKVTCNNDFVKVFCYIVFKILPVATGFYVLFITFC